MGEFYIFRERTLKQLRMWAWAASIVPLTALSGIFFIWVFGDDIVFGYALIIGEVTMFAVAVVWWWWAIYVINNLVKQWDTTRNKVVDVLSRVREIKTLVQDAKSLDSDK
jgi:hypothetical protein